LNITLTLSRVATGICGAVVGCYAAYSAFRNGQSMAGGLDGIAFGSAFAAVVIGGWFLLPLADRQQGTSRMLMRLGWAMCLVFVLINAVGFTATHRTTVVGDKTNSITAYDTALTGLKSAQEALTAMKSNARWQKTSGCSDVTAERSIEFCRQVQQAQADIAKYQPVVASGKPATADAQADTIAWVIQADTGVVSRAMPIFMAVVLDVAASLFIWAAMTTYQTAVAPSVVVETPKKAPKPATKKKITRRKAWNNKQTQKLLADALKKPDRRKMKTRNDNQKKLVAAND
jgi:hypothetical protein